MKHTVKFIRIIGGQNDGETMKVRKLWEVDEDEVLRITSDGEQYKLDRIENETAYFVHDGFVV